MKSFKSRLLDFSIFCAIAVNIWLWTSSIPSLKGVETWHETFGELSFYIQLIGGGFFLVMLLVGLNTLRPSVDRRMSLNMMKSDGIESKSSFGKAVSFTIIVVMMVLAATLFLESLVH